MLDNFSINFNQPRCCVIGSNGSGKSTLLVLIAGLLEADSGVFSYLEMPPVQNTSNNCSHRVKLSAKERKKVAAIASDSITFPPFLTAKQVLMAIVNTWQLEWPKNLIDTFNFNQHINKTVSALSSGNLKKLQLISAFLRKPPILLLDEPNVALDKSSVDVLWQLITHYEGQVIAASNEVELFRFKGFDIQSIQTKNAFTEHRNKK